MKIIHVMADGSERESLKGVVIPFTAETAGYYYLMAEYQIDKRKEKEIEQATNL
jgi:hypothetical protein